MNTHEPSPDFFQSILDARAAHALPPRLREQTEEFAQRALALLFPHFQSATTAARSPQAEFLALCDLANETVAPLVGRELTHLGEILGDKISQIRSALVLDAEAIFEADPAAESLDEVIYSYPGFYAIALHRVAHCFYHEGVPLFPRLIAEVAHRNSGVDIHPGASIGPRFSIDHGTGIVIGETTQIGANVRLYQGVTLGALAVKKKLKDSKRHPTLEDDVIVYAGATILGGNTTVGKGSIIGGNVWLTQSVEPGSVVTFASQTLPTNDDLLDYYL